MNVSSMGPVPLSADLRSRRYGTIAARIGFMFAHRLNIAVGVQRAGHILHLSVQDITRHPQLGEVAKWVCCSPHCAGKSWANKAALLGDHLDNRDLVKQEETHVYLAVAEVPARPAAAEKRNEKGQIIAEAVEARPATVMLLSDES